MSVGLSSLSLQGKWNLAGAALQTSLLPEFRVKPGAAPGAGKGNSLSFLAGVVRLWLRRCSSRSSSSGEEIGWQVSCFRTWFLVR